LSSYGCCGPMASEVAAELQRKATSQLINTS
jgi:hypothetical protein